MTTISPLELYSNLRNSYEFSTNTLDFLRKMGQSDISRFSAGPHKICLVNRPDLIESIFQQNRDSFIKPKFATKMGAAIFGDALTGLDDAVWLARRKEVSAAFTPKTIDSYLLQSIHAIEKRADEIVGGSSMDIEIYFRRFFIELYSMIFMDISFTEHSSELSESIEKALGSYGSNLQMGMQIPGWIPTPNNLEIRECIRRIRQLFSGAITIRENMPFEQANVLSLLLQLKSTRHINQKQLMDELIVMICVGAHQSAIAMTWLFYLTGIYPEHQSTIANEAASTKGFDWVATNGREPLRLTSACVSESLRLFPPFFMIGREAKNTCTFGGETFSKGETILASAWVTQRNPRIFENPNNFVPDRWFHSDEIPRFSYFPFGLGARSCIAQLLLKRLLPITAAKTMQKYVFQLATDAFVSPYPRVTLGFRSPVTMIVRER